MKMDMSTFRAAALGAALFALTSTLSAQEAEPGFTSLFNGKDLTGWKGGEGLWSVKDGCITGETKADPKLTHNTFLVYEKEFGDFELRFCFKFGTPWGNSGVQYRSEVITNGDFGPVMRGYQADFATEKKYCGMLYEEKKRGIICPVGQKTVIKAPDAAAPEPAKKGKGKGKGGKASVEVVGSLGTAEEVAAKTNPNEWNEIVVIAKGNHLLQFLNGKPTVDMTDEDPSQAAKTGLLGLQMHVGQPMIIQFKNIRIKPL